ncbi:MAG: S9 family peptidase [Chloroflexi bacterium]|nr:S9 family peptidase [Chloroflexota bacterium]
MPTPLSPETLIYGLTTAADPQVSPDGSRVAYVLNAISRESNKPSSQVWLCAIDGSDARRLTYAGDKNRMPRSSPDGAQLAFASNRNATDGIFVMPLAGGEAREVLRLNTTLNDLQWAPDGAEIAYVTPIDPANPSGEKPPEGAAPKVRVTSRIDYKQDILGYLGDTRRQLCVVDVATGTSRQLTFAPFDHNFPRWSPDGGAIAVTEVRLNGMQSQLAIVPSSGGEPELLGTPDGDVATYAWSPDGLRIVFTGEAGPRTWQPDIFVHDFATNETKQRTTDLQWLPDSGFANMLPPAMPAWLDDGRVLFHAFRAGASGLYVVDAVSGEIEQIEGQQALRSGLSVDAAGRHAVQAFASLEQTGELSVFDLQDCKLSVITAHNAAAFAESPPARWERFDIDRDGVTIEAWLLKPADFDPSRRYPLVIDVHGGPNGYYGYGFRHAQQVLATNGIVTVFCNPRGSSSYGRWFTQQVMGDWAGEDYKDIMAVLDAALTRPYLDPARTGIWGYSYGGFMTAWTIGHTDRFKAAVCGAPCFDLESMYGTSDIGHYFMPAQAAGPTPHEAREWYLAHSPSTFAHNAKTPTLIVQGEADDRCPVGQGEHMFTALKMAGCEVEFARYPGGSHQFMGNAPAEHRVDVLARILAWFQSHL